MISIGAARHSFLGHRSKTRCVFAFKPRRRCLRQNRLALIQTGRISTTMRTSRIIKALDTTSVADSSSSQKSVGEDLDSSYGTLFSKMENNRRVGILLHPTSLPGPCGNGDIGYEAFRFVDWLASCGCQCWQVLPLVPPDQMFYSPYTGLDANCGNPLLISLDCLIKEGLLHQEEAPQHFPDGHAEFPKAAKVKYPLLEMAAKRLLSEEKFHYLREELGKFRAENPWVEDSALFEVLRLCPEMDLKVWWEWPEPYRFRHPDAISAAKEKYKQQIDEFIAIQLLFHRQWLALKAYANSKGINIMGDMPIYVGGHSADVWANQYLFELSESGAPALVSGVPPDAFSTTGQLWGTPLYNWKHHEEEEFAWWSQRLGRAFTLFDEMRIDHFRGFAGYYAVEADKDTALIGVWKKGPGKKLFDAIQVKLDGVVKQGIVAEDLGMITPDVHKLRDSIDAPGMVVLQFAFGSGSDNIHLPHNHSKNRVVYPGTHDNPTAVGWFQENTQPYEREYLAEYFGNNNCVDDIAWALITESMKSVADTCIICLQDIMRLDNQHRMNFPGKAEGNWTWRVDDYGVWENLTQEASDLRRLSKVYNRLPDGWEF